jgi:hypothetical protein
MNEPEACNGPPCPKCGCRDATIIAFPQPALPTWYGAGRAKCNHCRLVYHFKEIPGEAVEHPVLRCTHCGGTDVKVTSTRGNVRHNKCKGCGKSFKTVDRSAAAEDVSPETS